MTPGQLVKAVSIALDVPLETVTQHDRNLAVAGLRTMGARGRNAPQVTPLDGTRVLLATLGSPRPMDSVQVLRACESMKYAPVTVREEFIIAHNEFERHFKLPPPKEHDASADRLFEWIAAGAYKHNFVEAVAQLVKFASEPITDPETLLKQFARLKIAWSSNGASIGHFAKVVYFASPYTDVDYEEEFMDEHELIKRTYGIRQLRAITGTAIMLLGRAFRENGLNFSSTKEALDDWFGVEPAKKPTRRAGAKNTSAATKPKSVV